jgi:hypothetical protein
MLVFTPAAALTPGPSVVRLGTVSRRWRRPVGRAAGSPLGIYGLCTGPGPGRYWPESLGLRRGWAIALRLCDNSATSDLRAI